MTLLKWSNPHSPGNQYNEEDFDDEDYDFEDGDDKDAESSVLRLQRVYLMAFVGDHDLPTII